VKFFAYISCLIVALAYLAGTAVLLMMGVTVLDIILRIFGMSITGAYDLVRACGVIAVACALPYVTATKGHIAIEFFYHKCGRTGRIILDMIFRISALILFAILTWQASLHGVDLYHSEEVFPNLGLPVFWIPFVISLNCLLMIVVFIYHMMHPGKEYIKA
jgi:TRAP-type C4-dicarboxylate transport system permease small subunit